MPQVDTIVGFYWTFGLPWAHFTGREFKSIDDAAESSTTIRLQRAAVREFARVTMSKLIHEFYFIEPEQRVTEQIEDTLRKACRASLENGAVLVYVDFTYDRKRWRPHMHLKSVVADYPQLRNGPISPHNIAALHKHFGDSRFRQEETFAGRRKAAVDEIILYRSEVSKVTDNTLARHLNQLGLVTERGVNWTQDNVRKFRRTHFL